MIYTNEQNYIDIANAIRSLGGVGTFKPDEMAEAISGLGYDWDAIAHRDFTGSATLTTTPRVYGLAGSLITSLDGSTTALSNYLCSSCTNLATVSLPNVTTTGTNTFQNCTALTSVSMASVTSIGNYMFTGCSELTTVNLPNTVTIGTYAFQNDAKLANLTLSADVAGTVGTYAFDGCTVLPNVNMPKVTTVGAYAFRNCKGFTSISFDKLKTLANYGFSGCSNATSVNLPEAVGTTSITYFFSSCTKLETVSLPKLAHTGKGFFQSCTSLVNIALPSCQTLSADTFKSDTKLEKVDILGKSSSGSVAATAFSGATKFNVLVIRGAFVAPCANISAFTNTPFASGKAGGTLYVPSAQIDTYKTASNWTLLFGDDRAAGYVNNQILAIEGSPYENYYVDGTAVPTA